MALGGGDDDVYYSMESRSAERLARNGSFSMDLNIENKTMLKTSVFDSRTYRIFLQRQFLDVSGRRVHATQYTSVKVNEWL